MFGPRFSEGEGFTKYAQRQEMEALAYMLSLLNKSKGNMGAEWDEAKQYMSNIDPESFRYRLQKHGGYAGDLLENVLGAAGSGRSPANEFEEAAVSAFSSAQDQSPFVTREEPTFSQKTLLKNPSIFEPPRGRIEVEPLQNQFAVSYGGGAQTDVPVEQDSGGSWFRRTPLGQDLGLADGGKIQLPFQPGPAISGFAEKGVRDDGLTERSQGLLDGSVTGTAEDMRQRAQQAIAMRERKEETDDLLARQAKKQADYQKLMEAARGQDEWVRESVGKWGGQELSDPLEIEDPSTGAMVSGGGFSSPDKGILMADIDPEKLKKIRAEAFLKGQRGSLRGGNEVDELMGAAQGLTPGGGSFSQVKPMEGTDQRLAARDEWARNQDLRDARWDIDVARQKGDLDAKKLATESLLGLKEQRLAAKQQSAQNAIVQALGGGNGTIPFAKAMQAQASGLKIPAQSIGSDPQSVKSRIQSMLQYEDKALSKYDPVEAVTNPIIAESIKGSEIVKALYNTAASKIDAGADPDAVWNELMNNLMALANENMAKKQAFYQQYADQLAPQPEGE